MIYLLILPPETKENKSDPLFIFLPKYINAMIKLASRLLFQTRCDRSSGLLGYIISYNHGYLTEVPPLEHCLKVFLKISFHRIFANTCYLSLFFE